MATVIDSLLIELGLDTSKFDAAQKKSVEELRKFDEQAQKTAKNTQQGAKNTGDSFAKTRDSLLALGVALVGFKGFTQFVGNMTTGNAALGRNANLLSMSARELDAWGGVLKSVGGDLEGFQSSIQAMQQGIANIKLGDAAILTPLARLGALSAVDLNKGTVDIYKLADALKAFREANGEQLTYALAQQIGLSKEMFMVMEQGSDKVRQLYNENYKLSGITEENTKAAAKFQAQLGILAQSLSGAKNSIMDQLYPALGALADGTTRAVNGFVEGDKKLDGFLSQLTLIAGAALSLEGALASLKVVGVTVGEGLSAAFSKVFGSAALLFHSESLNKGEDEQLKAMWEKYDKENGTNYADKYKKPGETSSTGASGKATGGDKGLPRNLRNNNPGNIEYGKFAKEHGATGSDGRFAIFPDMKTGENAMAALLMGYAKGGNNTISSIVRKWSPAGDNGEANTNAYVADVAKKTGIDPNKQLSMGELAAVQQAMTQHEGMVGSKVTAPGGPSGGNTSVQTTIGTINVQTQATDANGIAGSIGKSLQNNSLINY
ncbi:MAG: hypothetical protein B7Z19_00745, partial [Polynucleobacter sp. 32-46-5]